MNRFAITVAMATLVATPALARPYNPATLDGPWIGPQGQIEISAKRAAALRECSAIAAQYPQYEWGNMEIFQYRACMARHGEVE